MLRIEGQNALQSLNRIDQKEAEKAEAQKRSGVLGPTLFDVVVHAGGPVGELLEPVQRRVQERAPPLEDVRHVSTQGLGADENHCEKHEDLKNSRASHMSSLELFRAQ